MDLDPTDWELVKRARSGDRKAFHMLVERHSVPMYETAAMMTGSPTDAQDIVQETFLGAFQGLARFEGRSSVKTWLLSILIRQVAMHHRREAKHRMPSLDQIADSDSSGISGLPGAGRSWVAGADARMDVMDLLDGLSTEHREVLVLRELEGLSYDEMAVLLGLPRGTVESRLFRAREAMRQFAQRKKG